MTKKILILSILLMGCQKEKNLLLSKVVVDKYHELEVEDPYRYAEDLSAPNVKNWIAQQNEAFESMLSRINKKEFLIDKLYSYDERKANVISKIKVSENGRYFYLKRLPQENTPKLYYKKSFHKKEALLFDPKDFKKSNNTEYAINYIQPNWNGTKIVIGLTYKGKEISEMIIIDVSSKEIYPEIIKNAWPSNSGGIRWLPNNEEFIYVRYQVIDPNAKGFLKNIESVLFSLSSGIKGTKTIFSRRNNTNLKINEEDYPIVSFRNSSNPFLIGMVAGGLSYYDSYYLDINSSNYKNWKPLFKKADEIKSFVVKGDSIIYRTAKNAPNFKICITSIKNPDFEDPKVLVEEYKNEIITDLEITKEGLYFVTSKNGVEAQLYEMKGNTITNVKFPVPYGSISISSNGSKHDELWISVRGWVTHQERFEYKKGRLTPKNLNQLDNEKLDVSDIVVEEIEVKAHDGEKIPLSLIYKKNTKRNGQNRLMMDGYGAFGISMKPSFSLRRLLWIEEGGIYAVAHVRGGGEKGDDWHKGGYKASKPNTWKDFIDCAKFLINNKYTKSEKLAIWSGSAGGILIGRAITERPDLFSTAIIEFGTLDLIRSMKDANGANIAKEFGSIKDEKEFSYLLEMDAYYHLKENEKYPATLITAGLNDPRVPAWNSVKFSARIQAANTSNTPNFLLIDSDTGHARNDTKFKEFERYANILSFALWRTGHPEYQPK